jgi:hypothetical protein
MVRTPSAHPRSIRTCKLQIMETAINSALPNQISMRAYFTDLTLIDHNNLASLANRGQSMSDDEDRSVTN